MKKVSHKKVAKALLWATAFTAVALSLAFVSEREGLIRATAMDIRILNDEENFFLSEKDVHAFFSARKDSLIDCQYKSIDLPLLEKALSSHPAVESAEVAADLNGHVRVNVIQRTPVLRVINKDGESYYVDSTWNLMPLNDNYSARVLVASGEISEPFAGRSQLSVRQMAKSKAWSELTVLDDLMAVATYLRGDSTLSALIHQVYVNAESELELFPIVGNHRIVLGDAKDLDMKFRKLKLFYTEGLSSANGWNKYSSINLKYRNLVVCTKK